MSGRTRLFLAFAVGMLRFFPQAGITREVTYFAGGMGVGLLIGVLVTWAGNESRPDRTHLDIRSPVPNLRVACTSSL
jgi:hypothetical protein